MRIFAISICLLAMQLFAYASESFLMHVYIAEKWFKAMDTYEAQEKKDFVLGVLINEIGYLRGVSFTPKLSPGISLRDIYETKNAFVAGNKFHSYLKSKELKSLERLGVLRLISGIPEDSVEVFFKLLQDEVIYDPHLGFQASNYLSGISLGEILMGLRVEKIAIWHGVLYKYFSGKPSVILEGLKDDKRVDLGVDEETVPFWKAALLFFSTNPKVRNYVTHMLEEYDDAFELFKLKYQFGKA